ENLFLCSRDGRSGRNRERARRAQSDRPARPGRGAEDTRMKRFNVIILGAAVAAVIALAAWALQPRAIAVETARVSMGIFEKTVSDDGKTRARERYTVSAPLA